MEGGGGAFGFTATTEEVSGGDGGAEALSTVKLEEAVTGGAVSGRDAVASEVGAAGRVDSTASDAVARAASLDFESAPLAAATPSARATTASPPPTMRGVEDLRGETLTAGLLTAPTMSVLPGIESGVPTSVPVVGGEGRATGEMGGDAETIVAAEDPPRTRTSSRCIARASGKRAAGSRFTQRSNHASKLGGKRGPARASARALAGAMGSNAISRNTIIADASAAVALRQKE